MGSVSFQDWAALGLMRICRIRARSLSFFHCWSYQDHLLDSYRLFFDSFTFSLTPRKLQFQRLPSVFVRHVPQATQFTLTYEKLLFRQKLSHKSVKAYVTMPIGIIGIKSLVLLDWSLRWFSNKERERTNTRVCAVSFHHAETPWGSIKQPCP